MTITQKNNTLFLIAKGMLDLNDCENFFLELNRQINSAKDVRCYFEIKDCQGCTPEVFEEDYFQNLEKEKFTKLLMPFSRAHIRYFDSKDSVTAKKWIEA